MKLIGASAALVLLSLSVSARVEAAPITYEVSGTGSGKIGAVTFTNAQIDMVGISDTTSVVPLAAGGPYANPLSNLTLTITGVGTATVTDVTEIFGLPFTVIDPEIPPVPFVIFGRTDAPPDLNGFTGIGGTGSTLLAGYTLMTAIGPITDTGGFGFPLLCGTPGHDPCLHTTLGDLSFTTNDFNGQTTFSATVAPVPVPEPATVLLVGGGLAMLRQRRSRHVS